VQGVRHATDASLVPLLSQCVSLTHLDLTRVERMTDDTLIAVGGSCHQLKSLLLFSDAQLSDVGLIAVAKGCPQLERLDMTGLARCTDHAVIALADHCPHLITLTLQWCTALTDACLESLAVCHHLRRCSLHGCKLMTLNGLRSLAQGASGSGSPVQELDVNGIPGVPHRDVTLMRTLFPNLITLASL
jgi:F-box/leucine-rich repeat protein 2/20